MAGTPDDVTTIVRRFAGVVREQLPVRSVFLYGSHARDEADSASDIDVGVVIRSHDHDRRIDFTTILYRCAREVDCRIEPRCIFQDEYENPRAASILAEIIRQSREVA